MQLKFAQLGLRPEQESYEICQMCWLAYFTNSLTQLITPGAGAPNED